VIDVFLEAGVNCMHPMEPAANMDVVQVRAKYGNRLSFYGGIDKYVLRQGRSAVDAELERKIPPLLETGGCVIALDHRIPNGTPLDTYRYYLQRIRELIGE
jgi:uroporphyrinogen decarboxylase